MPNVVKHTVYWVTKEGRQIPISSMPSSHLLNTIHFIERSRFQQLADIAIREIPEHPSDQDEMIQFYSDWPEKYQDLLAEAEKRKLIKRK